MSPSIHRLRVADRAGRRRASHTSSASLATMLCAVLGATVLPLTSCETLAAGADEHAADMQAKAGVLHPSLGDLCADVWRARLAADPFEATYLGDPRFNGEIPNVSPVGQERRADEIHRLIMRARRISDDDLVDEDAVTRAIMIDQLERERVVLRTGLDDWTVDPLESITTQLLNLASVQPVRTETERLQMVERWQSLPSYVRESYKNLRRSLTKGQVSSHNAVSEVIAQIDAVLDTPPMDSPLVEPALGGGEWVELGAGATLHGLAFERFGDGERQTDLRLVNRHLSEGERGLEGTRVLLPAKNDPLGFAERGDFLYGVLTAVEEGIYPALVAYRDILANEVLPRARPDAKPGLVHLYGGDSVYKDCIAVHTTLPLDAREVHEFGLQEVERIRAEISALGTKVFGTSTVAEVQSKLRHDRELFFETREEVEAKAVEALQRAEAKLPEFFGILPNAPCEVVRTPAHEEAASTIAYYRGPAIDGSRPGRYYINTYEPTTRPRYDAEVLAFHEAVPGHHLQIAIAQELESLPSLRRHAFHTAFGEGWALYIERLADEMGLYSSDIDRFGMLSFDAWRASRLVVDTGLHSLGWSRDEAIDYLYENTLLGLNNCENEVDRYIAWPGQALAYKIGQREILRLRDYAREELGAAFDYRDFHDRVLQEGSLPLGLLAERVEAWAATSTP